MNRLLAFVKLVATFGLMTGIGSAYAADFQAYSINPSAPLVGNQAWTGALGNDFDVNTTITIKSLGAYDSGADGIISGSIIVRIFDLSDKSVLATATITGSGDTLVGQFRFKDITPLTLEPGSYSVVAIGFGDDNNANENVSDIPLVADDGAGLISFVNSRWGNGGVDPTTTFPAYLTIPGYPCSGQPEACFGAGSFQYSAAAEEFSCEGFFSPFDSPLSFKANSKRAIPVKMILKDSDGIEITDADLIAPPVVQVTKAAATGSGIDGYNGELLPGGLSEDGNAFRYDWDDMQWIINLATKQYTASGLYTVSVVAGDSSYVVDSCSQTFERQ